MKQSLAFRALKLHPFLSFTVWFPTPYFKTWQEWRNDESWTPRLYELHIPSRMHNIWHSWSVETGWTEVTNPSRIRSLIVLEKTTCSSRPPEWQYPSKKQLALLSGALVRVSLVMRNGYWRYDFIIKDSIVHWTKLFWVHVCIDVLQLKMKASKVAQIILCFFLTLLNSSQGKLFSYMRYSVSKFASNAFHKWNSIRSRKAQNYSRHFACF